MYDEAYLEEYQRRADTHIGRKINEYRWALVEAFCSGGTLLDYGCGAGVFHQTGPGSFRGYGYDINPHVDFGPIPGSVDILTMWDVIEHLPGPLGPIEQYRPEYVFLSTPNIENAENIERWKHYKPGEHLFYFSPKGIKATLLAAGYDIVHFGYGEGEIRDEKNPEAIMTVVGRRR